MANINGVNVALNAANKKSAPGMHNGHLKCHYDECTFGVAVVAINDTIALGKIPKGAKVRSVIVKCPSTGTTGIFKLGYAATTADSSDRTADLGSGYDAGGQAVDVETNVLAAALEEEKDLIATFTEATDAATTDKLQVSVAYIVD